MTHTLGQRGKRASAGLHGLLQRACAVALTTVLALSTPAFGVATAAAGATALTVATPRIAFADAKAASATGGPLMIAGWSAALVATGSMNSVIPQGSLIVCAPVEEAELSVGDDITYMSSSTTTVTHRIIEVTDSAEVPGHRAFITQGVDNTLPDKTPVEAQNVVGRVVFHSHVAGVVLGFIRANWPLLVALLVIAWGFLKVMRRIQRSEAKVAGAKAPASCALTPSVQIQTAGVVRRDGRALAGPKRANSIRCYYMKERGRRFLGHRG